MSKSLEQLVKQKVSRPSPRILKLGDKKINSFSQLLNDLSKDNSLAVCDRSKCLELSKLKRNDRRVQNFRKKIYSWIQKGKGVYIPHIERAYIGSIEKQKIGSVEKFSATTAEGKRITYENLIDVELEEEKDVYLKNLKDVFFVFQKRVREEISDEDYQYLAIQGKSKFKEKDMPMLLDIEKPSNFEEKTIEVLHKRFGLYSIATKQEKWQFGEEYEPYPQISSYGEGLVNEESDIFSFERAQSVREFLREQTRDFIYLTWEWDIKNKSSFECFKIFLEACLRPRNIFQGRPLCNIRELTYALLLICSCHIQIKHLMRAWKQLAIWLTVPNSHKADSYIKLVSDSTNLF